MPNRKKIRFENYDYSDFGVYYITVCTKDKQRIFWTNKTFSAYKILGDAGISVGVVLRPPPVAEKGSKALSEQMVDFFVLSVCITISILMYNGVGLAHDFYRLLQFSDWRYNHGV